MKNALRDKLKNLLNKQIAILRGPGPMVKKKMTMRQCIETEKGVKKVQERAEMFRRIDKIILTELEKNIQKSHLVTQEHAACNIKKILGKPIQLRSNFENQNLLKLIKEIKFFQERSPQIQDQDLKELAQTFYIE